MKALSKINPRTELYMLDCKGLKILLGYFNIGCDIDNDVPDYYPKFINKLSTKYEKVKHLASDGDYAYIKLGQEINQHIRKATSYFRNLVRAEMTERGCVGNYKRRF